MATTPVTPDMGSMPAMPSGGGNNVEDRMAEKLSSAMMSEDSEPSQAEAKPAAATEPDTATDEVTEAEPSVEEAVATAPADETDAEPDPYADDETPEDPAIIEKFLKTPRGREIMGRAKLANELAKPSAEGGIGHVPSVQDVRQYFSSHRAAVQMYADFNSGDPGRIGNFFAHWLAPNTQAGMNALQHLEPTLAQIGPEAYGSVATPIMQRYEAALIDKWRSASDPALKQALYQAAQIIHHDTHDEWLPEQAFASGPAKPATQQEREQIQGEWQRLNQARYQVQRENDSRWNGALLGAQHQTLGSEIDKAFKQLSTMREKTPVVYDSLKERFANQVRQSLASDPEVWNLYLGRIEQARRTGDPAAMKQVVDHYRTLVVNRISSQRIPFLKQAGVAVRQQNSDAHAQLRRIASNTAPSNTGVPVKKSVVPASARKPGESNENYRERRIMEAMMGG